MQKLKKVIRAILLAPMLLVLLFEEWGWEPLARGFAALGRLPIWAKLELRITQLPPWAALLAFGIPALSLIPIKLLAIYMFGKGQVFLGLSLVIGAKITGTALAARLFQLTHPALMQLRWFARLYVPWKVWKDRMLAQIRASALWRSCSHLKARVKLLALRLWSDIRTSLS
ncbi:MAG: hypothetical protein H7228_16610 [Polaromonas sp.]|nr:hypothetical protein [Polaromonas sp.]